MNINIITEKDNEQGGYIAHIKYVNKEICIGDGNTEFEAIRDVLEVYEDLLKIYNSDSFSKNLVWKDNIIVELRNGNKYRLKGDTGILLEQNTDNDDCIEELWKGCYDRYLYYGVNAQHDVVKIFDENNNVLAEREHYNDLATTHFIRV